MTEIQKNLLALVAEHMCDYLRYKYYENNAAVDNQNHKDMQEAIQKFEKEDFEEKQG